MSYDPELAHHLAHAQHMASGQPGPGMQRAQSPHPGAMNGLGGGRPPSYASAMAGYPGSPTLQSRRGFSGPEAQMAAEGAQFARIPSAQAQAGSSRFRPPNTPSTAHESPRVPHAQAQLPPSQPSSANQNGSLAQQQQAAMLAQQQAHQQAQAQAQRMAEYQAHVRLQQQHHQQNVMATQQRRMAVASGPASSPKIGAAQPPMPPQQGMPPQQAQMARAPQRIVHTANDGGTAILRLLSYCSLLDAAMKGGTPESIQAFVSDFFADHATLQYTLVAHDSNETRNFEIPACALPLYLTTASESGVCGYVISYDAPTETVLSSPSAPGQHLGYLIECARVTWITTYSNGTQVASSGHQSARFIRVPKPPEPGQIGASGQTLLKLERIESRMDRHVETIQRHRIGVERIVHEVPSSSDPPHSANSSVGGGGEGSPTLSTGRGRKRKSTGGGRKIKTEEGEDELEDFAPSRSKRRTPPGEAGDGPGSAGRIACERLVLPREMTGPWGMSERGLRCLEMAESVAQMRDLMIYSRDNELGPLEALQRFADALAPAYGYPPQHAAPPIVHPSPEGDELIGAPR